MAMIAASAFRLSELAIAALKAQLDAFPLRFSSELFRDAAIELYFMQMEIWRRYPDATLTPSMAVDRVWHAHLALDCYEADCLKMAGRIIHHHAAPMISDLAAGWERNRVLFVTHFGVRLERFPAAELGVCANCQ